MAQPAPPGLAIPPPPAATFSYLDYYRNSSNDPTQGDFGPSQQAINSSLGSTPATALLALAGQGRAKRNGCFVSLREDPAHPDTGSTFLYTAVEKYTSDVGVTSPHDGRTYACAMLPLGRNGQTVELVSEDFELPGDGREFRVPITAHAFHDARTRAGADAKLLPVLEELGVSTPPATTRARAIEVSTTTSAIATTSMYGRNVALVPWPLIQHLLAKRLSPLELYDVASNVLGSTSGCTPFLNWAKLACIRGAPGEYSALYSEMPPMVFADPGLLQARQAIMDEYFPALPPATPAFQAPDSTALFFQEFISDQRRERERERAPKVKTVGETFGPSGERAILLICNVEHSSALPAIWSQVAAFPKKCHQVFLQAFRATAAALGAFTPLPTTTMIQQIQSVQIAGHNVHDLHQGINFFNVRLLDNSTLESAQLSAALVNQGHDFDALAAGETSASLADLTTMRSESARVMLPQSFEDVKKAIGGTLVVYAVLLGMQHPVTVAVQAFFQRYSLLDTSTALSFMIRQWGAHAPAIILRFLQIRVTNYLQGLECGTANVQALDLAVFFERIATWDTGSWTDLPEEFKLVSKKSKGDGSSVSTDSTASTNGSRSTTNSTGTISTKSARLVDENKSFNPDLLPFKEAGKKVKIVDWIKTAQKEAPKINGVPACVSFHVKGQCFQDCKRNADHKKHSKAEDKDLLDWCKLAMPTVA